MAINAGRLPVCFPYTDGCISISATGRYPPASFVFKAVMMPEAALLACYWLLNVAWIRGLERSTGQAGSGGTAVGVFGVAGALFLILYVTFLGTDEPFYELMRRFGVYFYFLFSVLAQFLLAVKTLRLPLGSHPQSFNRLIRLQLAFSLIPIALGALNLVLKSTLDGSDQAERVIEWIFALMMHSYFILSYFAWRDTGFHASFSTGSI